MTATELVELLDNLFSRIDALVRKHKLEKIKSKKELKNLIAKLRVYTISDQDDSGIWIRNNFPELFYIVSPGFSVGGAYHYATWSGISGDFFHARCTGPDFRLVSNEWLHANIQSNFTS